MQPVDAAVGGIGPSLNKAPGLQPVDQTADRDWLHFANPREFVLRHARLAGQAGQNDPLGTSHATRPGPLVEAGTHQPRHVVEDDQDVPFESCCCMFSPSKP